MSDNIEPLEPPLPANWDVRFMALAEHVATWSKHPGWKVGSVIADQTHIVRSLGYNGLPRGLDDTRPDRRVRPAQWMWAEHAERNAIYNAARTGMALEGFTIYSTRFPCMECARAIVQSGLKVLVSPRPDFDHPRWGEGFKLAIELLTEAGVLIRWAEESSKPL